MYPENYLVTQVDVDTIDKLTSGTTIAHIRRIESDEEAKLCVAECSKQMLAAFQSPKFGDYDRLIQLMAYFIIIGAIFICIVAVVSVVFLIIFGL